MTTFLVAFTGFILLGFAISAYTLFYLSYIPRIGFERTIHLQFDNVYNPTDSRDELARKAHPYPYGSVSLVPDVVGMQRYDVLVELSMPRTPDNNAAGNFMLDVSMYAPEERGSSVLDTVKDGIVPGSADTAMALAKSRRPAILPYRSPIIELAYKVTELHWYLLNWRQEADKLRINIFEGVEFAKGYRNVPATLRLEIQSTHQLQIYDAKVEFRARFRGLRWLMYNHRVLSAMIFIGCFWVTEVLFAGLAWAALTIFVVPPTQEVKAEEVHEVAERVKQEDGEEQRLVLSDTERVFPTTSQQQPLRYASPAIKQEETEMMAPIPDTVAKAIEADDEDEDADFFLDSGLGTSMESSASRRDSVRRRRGRMSPSDPR